MTHLHRIDDPARMKRSRENRPISRTVQVLSVCDRLAALECLESRRLPRQGQPSVTGGGKEVDDV